MEIFKCFIQIKLILALIRFHVKYDAKTIIQSNDSTTCDPWTAWEFTNHMEEETDCPLCLADCELTTYSMIVTSSEFRCGKKVQN